MMTLTLARVRSALDESGECQLIQALTIATHSGRRRCPDSARKATELSHPDPQEAHSATWRAIGSVTADDIRQGKEQEFGFGWTGQGHV